MKSDYTEGNAFQWSFFAPHDMDNFIAAIGGKKELETRLDTLFTTSSQIDGAEASGDITGLIGQYAHGNEPSHHMAYLYNWTDSPWKGQGYLDYIMQNFYTNEPDGIIGNEDCGQMSAWYVMSALGFYQVSPGIPVYTLGRPMVNKASMHVKGGIFEIVATNNNPANKYVKEVKLNGKVLETPFISHSDIIKEITQYFGIVSGETIIGANVFKDFFAGIRDIVGGRAGSYESVLREAKETALKEMSDHAARMGANAVIAVDLDYETVGGSGSMLMVTAAGTAVRYQ